MENEKRIANAKVTDEDRIRGSLTGLLVGDALGSPLQFGKGRDEAHYLREMKPCEVFGTPKGCWTDDGSTALCVMDSFVRCGGALDIVDVMKTFARWQDEGYLSTLDRSFDEGYTTMSAINAFKRSGSVVNGPNGSYGSNGSIMRFSPSYFIGRSVGDAEGVALRVSNATHNVEIVQKTVRRFVSAMDEIMRGARPTDAGRYRNVDGTWADKARILTGEGAETTLDAALWAFHTTDSFEDALVRAVNLGGDSDTIGAVCGQLAGAYYGINGIPTRWLKDLSTKWQPLRMVDDFVNALFAR